ncbi:MarR family transcriptional regulator [Amycolatopsis sp. NPDC023774]|uniref:MarR family winged helix-turn-helix transcriptional regulator n=1 Tax=Amycolatopsis sp. NPDC023774 TaxID=3155015 RepID=UPI0033F8AA76
MSSASEPPAVVTRRLGYLLKHAQLRLAELQEPLLAPHGVSGRQVAVLALLADGEPQSQQEAAARLGVDRTTMVQLVDELEDKALVRRQVDPADRRRRIVTPTEEGLRVLKVATEASDEAERRLLGPLAEREAAGLREALWVVVHQR